LLELKHICGPSPDTILVAIFKIGLNFPKNLSPILSISLQKRIWRQTLWQQTNLVKRKPAGQIKRVFQLFLKERISRKLSLGLNKNPYFSHF